MFKNILQHYLFAMVRLGAFPRSDLMDIIFFPNIIQYFSSPQFYVFDSWVEEKTYAEVPSLTVRKLYTLHQMLMSFCSLYT